MGDVAESIAAPMKSGNPNALVSEMPVVLTIASNAAYTSALVFLAMRTAHRLTGMLSSRKMPLIDLSSSA